MLGTLFAFLIVPAVAVAILWTGWAWFANRD